MSSEMKLLRKADLSLYYYVRDVILADYIEKEELVQLEYVPAISTTDSYVYTALTDMLPNPVDKGRGWVYFDEYNEGSNCYPFYTTTYSGDGTTVTGTPEQSQRITVYETVLSSGIETMVPISDDQYMIDYIDGRIVTSGTCSPTYIDYHWYYISLIDEWGIVDSPEPPAIVIDINSTDKKGYQIGPGAEIVRKVDLHVFASSAAERNDIVETLYDGLYLRSCPLYNFPNGSVLDYDGTFYGRKDNPNKLTSLFNRETIKNISTLRFEEVSARNVNLPMILTRNRDEIMLSDLNAYRAKVSFNMIAYTGS